MPILYPKDYISPVEVETAKKDTATVKDFIKSFVMKPMSYEEINKEVEKKYVTTNDESFHFLSEEISKIADEIRDEWHPIQEESVLETDLNR